MGTGARQIPVFAHRTGIKESACLYALGRTDLPLPLVFSMMIHIKRVYEEEAKEDGERFLVERLWPRGIKKEALHIKDWCKEVAPSTDLRRWFSHDPAKWKDFQSRYRAELDVNSAAWHPLLDAARRGPITLLYSSHDREHNNAVVLAAYLKERRVS